MRKLLKKTINTRRIYVLAWFIFSSFICRDGYDLFNFTIPILSLKIVIGAIL